MTTRAPRTRRAPVSATSSPPVTYGVDGGGMAVALDAAELIKLVNRLKRAQGQLAGVVRMLEQGRGCEDVVTQLSAVSKAVDRAGFAIISSGLRECLVASHGQDTVDVAKLQKLFLSLA